MGMIMCMVIRKEVQNRKINYKISIPILFEKSCDSMHFGVTESGEAACI